MTTTINSKIISTKNGRCVHRYAIDSDTGLTRRTIVLAEQAAKDWARANGHKVVSDIVRQGEYQAWVEPVAPGRLRTLAQLGMVNK